MIIQCSSFLQGLEAITHVPFIPALFDYVCRRGPNNQSCDGMQRHVLVLTGYLERKFRHGLYDCVYGTGLIPRQSRHNLMMFVFSCERGFCPLCLIFCVMMCRLHLHGLTKQFQAWFSVQVQHFWLANLLVEVQGLYCTVLYSDDWQKKYGVHFMFENRNKEFIVVIK